MKDEKPIPFPPADGACLIVVDLEATCWRGEAKAPFEIIEIGAVAWRMGFGVLGEFQTFVRPQLAPISDFCTELTTIRQEDVDAAPVFPDAWRNFREWSRNFDPFTLASWGYYDDKQLRKDCERHGIAYDIERHMNLKVAFAQQTGTKKMGLGEALRTINLNLHGTHHRGIDDARNVVRILQWLIQR